MNRIDIAAFRGRVLLEISVSEPKDRREKLGYQLNQLRKSLEPPRVDGRTVGARSDPLNLPGELVRRRRQVQLVLQG